MHTRFLLSLIVPLSASSACIAQCTPDWTQLSAGGVNASFPAARLYHGMAYDAARDRVVLYGGATGSGATLRGDQWEWDGSSWSLVSAAAAPGLRRGMGMVYDPARNRTVVFGGITSGGINAETWEFDSETVAWTQIITPLSPPPRGFAGMTYDSARQRVVLFGGWATGLNYLQDTWEYDGTTWVEVGDGSPTAPPPRGFHSLAYNPVTQRSVLFGGILGELSQTTYFNDTWEWNGSSWAQAAPQGTLPPIRAYTTLTFDGSLGKVVLFGGFEFGSGRLNDTWTWDGQSWALQNTPNFCTARQAHAVVYDSSRRRQILFGGIIGSPRNDTWQLAIPPHCPADVNCSGTATVQDIFDFLADYFNNAPAADFNASGSVTVQDIFDYLAAYFAGCG